MIGTAAAVYAGIPQLRKLFISKQADDFNMQTWLIWLFSQVTALMYTVAMHDVLYACVALFWLSFYLVMVAMIFKYRTKSSDVKLLATDEV
jgi:hypothetical protein